MEFGDSRDEDFRVDSLFFCPFVSGDIEVEDSHEGGVKSFEVPFSWHTIFWHVDFYGFEQEGIACIDKGGGESLSFHEVLSFFEDGVSLVIDDVVEFEELSSNIEVSCFDFLLSFFDGFIDPGVDDGFTFFQADLFEESVNFFGSEYPHEVIFEADEEARSSWVALSSCTSSELVIDSSAFVTFGSDDEESAGIDDGLFFLGGSGSPIFLKFLAFFVIFARECHDFDVSPELDVCSSSGHIGGDGDASGSPGLGDDVGFGFVLSGVEDFVLNFFFSQDFGEVFGTFYGGGPDQDGLRKSVGFFDFFENSEIAFF